MLTFKEEILQGIPKEIPIPYKLNTNINHAPKRKDILNDSEKKLALRNALRYFPQHQHATLVQDFLHELIMYGRIYMYRYMPMHTIKARPLHEYPYKSTQAGAIMLMIQNNLDHSVAQHPHELITYGGNGAVFQNWVQYRLTMQYLATMNDEQTLVMYSGHPMGLFPSHVNAPRVVITNGLMVPNYSQPDHWEKYNALGVTQYGQMTAGSYMYIGPQGIVHGTVITVMNATRILAKKQGEKPLLKLFVTCGLGGMSGAQPKAAVIAGLVCLVAEINKKAIHTRYTQKWVDEVFEDLDKAIDRAVTAINNKTPISIAYCGNIVDLWERLVSRNIHVDLGSDQSSLHNPFSGGYYPINLSLEQANDLMSKDAKLFKIAVQNTLKRHVEAINDRVKNCGMYFFDYGNAFLLEASRAGADVLDSTGNFKYPSYVQDILGPLCFDYGFGPFRWVCTSGDSNDLNITDAIALKVMKAIQTTAPKEIEQQLADNIQWIEQAQKNNLVVGSQARILYADAEGRMRIAQAFNKAIAEKQISAPIVLGRDHHDVSGTDSPYRETSNIYDGSQYTADMAVQNFVGDAFRGATWVSLHNGGGVGWGEVINGGFGLVLDGTENAENKLLSMLHWDVNNGIARRAWARNKEALFAITREMNKTPQLKITIANNVENDIINNLLP